MADETQRDEAQRDAGGRFASDRDAPRQPLSEEATATVAAGDRPETTSANNTEDLVRGSSPRLALHLSRGVAVGRYLILEPLGAGGMGEVYTAYDPDLDRQVALKLLRPTDRDPRRREARLLREAKSLARLSHPNVVTIFDVGSVGERLFVTMELVKGLDLGRWLRAASRSSEDILGVFMQAGRGLAAAHDAGLIHRDFKPANVLVGNDGRARVCDFGLAADSRDDSRRLPIAEVEQATPERLTSQRDPGDVLVTGAGAVLGTPAYMAPEQHAGQPALAASDQYSFCVALFRALYGRWPTAHLRTVQGTTNSANTETASRATGGVDAPLPDRLAARLEPTLRRGFDRSPEQRFLSMDALLNDLERAQRGSKRQRLVAAALTTLVLAASAILWGPGDDPCSGGAARMAGVWGSRQQERLVAAFAGTDSPYQEQAARVTTRTLDRYRETWVAMYGTTCRAARRGEVSAELLDRRMACLDERRLEIGSLIDVLAHDASGQLSEAAEAAASLTPLGRCTDTAALLAPLSPPDAATQEAVTRSRARLAEVKALRIGGSSARALQLAEATVAEAEVLGYWPLTAEAIFELGRVHESLSEVDRAIPRFEEALLAAEAGRHDYVAVESFLRLVRLTGHEKVDLERGERFAAMARSLLSGLGERRHLEAMLEDYLGLLSSRRGDYEPAMEHHKRSLALADPEAPLPELGRAATLIRLGNAERAAGHLADAERDTAQAVELYLSVHGGFHPEVALALERLGGIVGERGDLQRALSLRRRAEDIVRRSLGVESPQLADTLTNLGSILLSLGEPAQARQAFLEAAAIYDQVGNAEEQSIVANNLGMAALDEGLGSEALPYFERALALQTSIDGPDHPNTALAIYNLADAFFETGDPTGALTHYLRALEVWRKRLGDDHFLLAHGTTGEGRALLALGRFGEAAARLGGGLERWLAAGRSPIFAAETRFHLARALWPLGEHHRALEMARLARPPLAESPQHQDDLAALDQWLSERSSD